MPYLERRGRGADDALTNPSMAPRTAGSGILKVRARGGFQGLVPGPRWPGSPGNGRSPDDQLRFEQEPLGGGYRPFDLTRQQLHCGEAHELDGPIESMGRAAVKLLVSEIEGTTATPERLLFEPELVVRGSTAPPPQ